MSGSWFDRLGQTSGQAAPTAAPKMKNAADWFGLIDNGAATATEPKKEAHTPSGSQADIFAALDAATKKDETVTDNASNASNASNANAGRAKVGAKPLPYPPPPYPDPEYALPPVDAKGPGASKEQGSPPVDIFAALDAAKKKDETVTDNASNASNANTVETKTDGE